MSRSRGSGTWGDIVRPDGPISQAESNLGNSSSMLSAEEVAKHNYRRSCWVIIKGQAYDVTQFVDEHPGGANVILGYAGKDATKAYEPVHPPGTIEKWLPKDKHLGAVDPSTLQEDQSQQEEESRRANLPPLSVCLNLDDIEAAAEKAVSARAWSYFHSAADSLAAVTTNRQDWSKVTFRPRVLRNVSKISMKRSILGFESSLPFLISPAAMARLGHPDGELCLARGAARKNMPYCVSSYSSTSFPELANVLKEERKGGALFFQLYVPKMQENAKRMIEEAKSLGFKALVITVDTPVVGKREEDERYKAQLDYENGVEEPRTDDPSPSDDVETPILRGVHSSTLDWNDLPWIREAWGDLPIVIKGVQTAEDAIKASQAGVQGIILSNHGGRQLDFAPSAIRTLLELRKFCPEVFSKLQIFLDGGIRRGTDILKAIALGATAVCMGRPFMYALGAYGTEGVLKAIQILSDEIDTSMRLLGVTDLSQLNEHYVNTVILERELPPSLGPLEWKPQSKL